MLQPKSITTKIYIPLGIILMLGFSAIIFNSMHELDKISQTVYEKESISLQKFMQKSLQRKFDIALTNAISLSQNSDFKEALRTNNRQLALERAQKAMQQYKRYSHFKNIKIHLHTADAHSFVRAWKPQKYGDDLRGFRHTINEVIRTRRAFSAIEVGKAGLTFRGLAPIIDDQDGSYLGSIEFMMGFRSNISELQKDLQSDALILMDQKYLSIAKKLQNNPKIAHYVITQKKETLDPKLMNDLKVLRTLSFKQYYQTPQFLLSKLPLYDYKKEKIGYILLAEPLSKVAQIVNESKSVLVLQMTVMMAINMFILAFLVYIIKLIKQPLNTLV